VIVASPEYLEQFGAIETFDDLKPPHHMVKVFHKAIRLPKWQLMEENGDQLQIDLPHQLCVNTITAALTGCIDGLGLAILPEFICREHLKAGRLVRLLPNYKMQEVWVSLVYPDRQLMPKRKKLLIDYLLDVYKKNQ